MPLSSYDVQQHSAGREALKEKEEEKKRKKENRGSR
jgi:hypothetical protein